MESYRTPVHRLTVESEVESVHFPRKEIGNGIGKGKPWEKKSEIEIAQAQRIIRGRGSEYAIRNEKEK